jgi:hypothetical protein
VHGPLRSSAKTSSCLAVKTADVLGLSTEAFIIIQHTMQETWI